MRPISERSKVDSDRSRQIARREPLSPALKASTPGGCASHAVEVWARSKRLSSGKTGCAAIPCHALEANLDLPARLTQPRRRLQKVPEFADPRFVAPPALNRPPIDGLPDLPVAGRYHGPVVPFWSRTSSVPFNSEERDEPFRALLRLGAAALAGRPIEHLASERRIGAGAGIRAAADRRSAGAPIAGRSGSVRPDAIRHPGGSGAADVALCAGRAGSA